MNKEWIEIGLGFWITMICYGLLVPYQNMTGHIIAILGWFCAGILAVRIGLGLNTLDNIKKYNPLCPFCKKPMHNYIKNGKPQKYEWVCACKQFKKAGIVVSVG
jgi:hypothetical protein